MTIELSPERALELLREVVAEYGEDYVYRSAGLFCAYADAVSASPSCLVGHVLHRAGVTVPHLVELDQAEADTAIDVVQSSAFTLAPDARRLLRQAQYQQDQGATWGEALKEAELIARRAD